MLQKLRFLYKKEIVDYQHAGEASIPYLAQYSVVCEDVPVTVSWANMTTNIAIKDILNPLNTNFNTFLMEGFLEKTDNAIVDMENSSI